MKRLSLLAPLFAFWIAPLPCATLQRLSLDDMIAQSTAIVRGTVVSSYAAFSGPVIYTHYKIKVSETLKGAGQATVEVLVPGGIANNLRQTFAGAPEFQPGGEFVFFLWTGKAGLTQVLGLTQGLFALAENGASDPMATRAASRELMLEPSTARPVKDQTLVMRLSELRLRIGSTLAAGQSVGK